MKKFSIVTHIETQDGKQWPIDLKQKGFVDTAKIKADEVANLAGWYAGQHMVGTGVVESVEMCDEQLNTVKYIENANFDSIGPQVLKPRSGQSWIFVLGDALHLN